MRVEGTCRSGNRGGCPLSCAHHIAGRLPCIPFCPLVFPFPAYHQGKKHQKQGKTGQKLDFLWCALVFSRENRRQEGAKSKHIFEIKEGKQVRRWSAACLLACPLVQRWAGLRGIRTCQRLLWSSGRVFPPFVRSLALSLVRCLQICLCFAF